MHLIAEIHSSMMLFKSKSKFVWVKFRALPLYTIRFGRLACYDEKCPVRETLGYLVFHNDAFLE